MPGLRKNSTEKGAGLKRDFIRGDFLDSFKSKKEMPGTAKERIAELLELPLKDKGVFVPAVGTTLKLGPFVYEVSVVNVGQLRFTAKLHDIVIDGVNDGKSGIINPKTGTGFGKDVA
jgi:hypothetical protein